ncbi:hypothetical protein IL306_000981 [Fusarium sp. DS 682]|nr:hypothetical protein IL306_000981 [Fusarium sp. DS 682]
MATPTSFRAVYKQFGEQEIDVDVYLPHVSDTSATCAVVADGSSWLQTIVFVLRLISWRVQCKTAETFCLGFMKEAWKERYVTPLDRHLFPILIMSLLLAPPQVDIWHSVW